MSDSEIAILRAEVRLLQAQVSQLQERVAELEGFEVVSSPGGYRGPVSAAAPESAAATSTSSLAGSSGPRAQGGEVPSSSAATTSTGPSGNEASEVQSWEFRLKVAKEIGIFLRRSLEGVYHGNSGRHQIALKSRLYIIVRDRAGIIYTNPVKVLRTWKETKALVESGGDLGDAVFVGVPSEREGQTAVLEAGFTWPALRLDV